MIEEDIQKWVERKMREARSLEHWRIPLDHHHLQVPQPDCAEKTLVREIDGGNYLYRQDWQRDEKNGGLRLVGRARIDAQKKVIRFLLRRIGSTLLTGKSLTNLSMPVHIFETRSILERMSNALTFAPTYLERAAKLDANDFLGRLRQVFLFQYGFLITFLSMEKVGA